MMKKSFFPLLLSIVVVCFTSCVSDEQLTPQEKSERNEQIIKAFLTDNQLQADKTSSGLHYFTETPSTGIKPLFGDTVLVHYTSMVLGSTVGTYEYGKTYGTIYESSRFKQEPTTISVGQLINPPFALTQGWKEALELMPNGSRMVFFMPSSMAFGSNGYSPFVPGDAVVVFDIELLEVRPAF